MKKPRAEVLPPRAPSKRDVEALLDYFWENDRTLWLAVRITSTLGLRRSELLALKWSDFLLSVIGAEKFAQLRIERGVVADPETKKIITTDTKGGGQSHRTLWLDEELTDVIVDMLNEHKKHISSYVFSDNGRGNNPWYPDTINKKLSRARVAIAEETGQGNTPITFRTLRIFCASVVFANQLDVRTAKAVLGHASLQTTDRYYIAFNDEQSRAATVGVGEQLRRSPLRGIRY